MSPKNQVRKQISKCDRKGRDSKTSTCYPSSWSRTWTRKGALPETLGAVSGPPEMSIRGALIYWLPSSIGRQLSLWTSAALCPCFPLCQQGSGVRGASGQNMTAVTGVRGGSRGCEAQGPISRPGEKCRQSWVGGPTLRLWGNSPQTLSPFDLSLII